MLYLVGRATDVDMPSCEGVHLVVVTDCSSLIVDGQLPKQRMMLHSHLLEEIYNIIW